MISVEFAMIFADFLMISKNQPKSTEFSGGGQTNNLVGKPILTFWDHFCTILDYFFRIVRPAELVPHDERHDFMMIWDHCSMIFDDF